MFYYDIERAPIISLFLFFVFFQIVRFLASERAAVVPWLRESQAGRGRQSGCLGGWSALGAPGTCVLGDGGAADPRGPQAVQRDRPVCPGGGQQPSLATATTRPDRRTRLGGRRKPKKSHSAKEGRCQGILVARDQIGARKLQRKNSQN